MTVLGLGGALVFAFGGYLIFDVLFKILARGSEVNQTGVSVFSFLGFLLVGLGLWLIINDAKARPIPKV